MRWLENTVDATVRAFSPEKGNRRAAARLRHEYATKLREQAERRPRRDRSEYAGDGGFDSAASDRDSRGWRRFHSSPDSALEEAREEQLIRSDSAYKCYELATNHVEGRVVRVSGCGSSMDPCIDDEDGSISEGQAEEWNRILSRQWSRQTECLGVAGEPLWEIQQLLTRHDERHGEWFLLIGDRRDPLAPTSLAVEVIHPNRIETPPKKASDTYCRLGIQFDRNWVPVGYWVRNSHPNDGRHVDERHTYYPARLKNGLPRMVHHYEKTEAGQHRGYPRMQVGFRRLKNSDDYDEAEVERNYIASCHAVFVRTDLEQAGLIAGDVVNADGKRVRSIEPGAVQYLGESDEVNISSPNGAPSSFEGFMVHQGRMFAAGAGSSYEFLANDFRGMSYSTARVLHNIEEAACDVKHKSQTKALMAIWRHFVNRMILVESMIPVSAVEYRSQPWVYETVRIVPPMRRAVDPTKEDRNELTLIEKEVRPSSDLTERKNGQPARAVYKRIARDKRMREEAGLNPILDPQREIATQAGGENPAASEANTERQEVAGAS